jgi:hypothetical protein
MSDELKERNILKLIVIVRFACATRDVGHLTQTMKVICRMKSMMNQEFEHGEELELI